MQVFCLQLHDTLRLFEYALLIDNSYGPQRGDCERMLDAVGELVALV